MGLECRVCLSESIEVFCFSFQPAITYPVQIPLIPPSSDSAFEFYNNNVKVSVNQCWEIEKETHHHHHFLISLYLQQILQDTAGC